MRYRGPHQGAPRSEWIVTLAPEVQSTAVGGWIQKGGTASFPAGCQGLRWLQEWSPRSVIAVFAAIGWCAQRGAGLVGRLIRRRRAAGFRLRREDRRARAGGKLGCAVVRHSSDAVTARGLA